MLLTSSFAKHYCEKEMCSTCSYQSKAGFPLGEFVRANREKSNLIGWRQTLTSSPANHIRFLLVRANKFAKWKTGLKPIFHLANLFAKQAKGEYDWLVISLLLVASQSSCIFLCSREQIRLVENRVKGLFIWKSRVDSLGKGLAD